MRASWTPYSNSVAPSSRIAIGRSRTFHSPNEKNTGAPSRNRFRSIGVSTIARRPSLRFVTTTPTEVSSSATSGLLRTLMKKMQAAENRNVSESIQNAQLML